MTGSRFELGLFDPKPEYVATVYIAPCPQRRGVWLGEETHAMTSHKRHDMGRVTKDGANCCGTADSGAISFWEDSLDGAVIELDLK